MRFGLRIERIVGLDLRSLALFRMCVSLVILYDLASRSFDLVAHYTDFGVLPVSTLVDLYGNRIYASLHVLASGSVAGEVAVFVFHSVAAIALLLGFYTRSATALCWFFAISLQIRTLTFSKMGGDAFVACLLLFGIFLPLGARWSWDRCQHLRRSPSPSTTPPDDEASNVVTGVAPVAFILQICVLYWSTGWLKTGELWEDGSAVWYLLNIDMLGSPLSSWLASQGWAIEPLTLSSRFAERWLPFVLFIPFATSLFRIAFVVGLSLLHVGLGLFMYLGAYPIMCISGLVALLPSQLWDRWLPALRGSTGIEPATRGSALSKRAGYGWPAELITGLMLVHVLLFAAGSLSIFGFERSSLPSIQVQAARAIGLKNTWSMMSPNPGTQNWWIVFDGQLASGKHADPFRNEPLTWERPENVRDSLRSWRWRLRIMGLLATSKTNPRHDILWKALGDHLCATWNTSHPAEERLIKATVSRMIEPIGRHGRKPVYREHTADFVCSSGRVHGAPAAN